MSNVDTNNYILRRGSETNLDFSEMPEFRMGLHIIINYGLLILFIYFCLSTHYLPIIKHRQR